MIFCNRYILKNCEFRGSISYLNNLGVEIAFNIILTWPLIDVFLTRDILLLFCSNDKNIRGSLSNREKSKNNTFYIFSLALSYHALLNQLFFILNSVTIVLITVYTKQAVFTTFFVTYFIGVGNRSRLTDPFFGIPQSLKTEKKIHPRAQQ